MRTTRAARRTLRSHRPSQNGLGSFEKAEFSDKFSVTGVDNSEAAIESNSKVTKLVTYKFSSVAAFREVVPKVDVAYTRFVLHALPFKI